MSQQVFPTRMALTTFKGKRVGAKKGFELLKKKADALKIRFQAMLKEIKTLKLGMTQQASEAFFSLTQAIYAAGDFRNQVLEDSHSAQYRVENRIDNVAGVKLPVFKQVEVGQNERNLGLSAGGGKIQQCREKFRALLAALIKLASLQTSFLTLDEALKVTNRRVNALENVTLPKIENIINYITRELDELEREDFTRLKKVQSKKNEKLKALEAERSENRAANGGISDPFAGLAPEEKNILEDYSNDADEDVIFK